MSDPDPDLPAVNVNAIAPMFPAAVRTLAAHGLTRSEVMALAAAAYDQAAADLDAGSSQA